MPFWVTYYSSVLKILDFLNFINSTNMEDLPFTLREKILLELPYDKVEFVKTQGFWKKKALRDFGMVIKLNDSRDTYRIIRDATAILDSTGVLYLPRSKIRLVIDDFVKFIKDYDYELSSKLYQVLVKHTLREMENDEDLIFKLADVALKYEKEDNEKYRNILLSELFKSWIEIYPDEDCYSSIFGPIKKLFKYLSNKKKLTASLLTRIFINALDLTKRKWEARKSYAISTFVNLVNWIKTTSDLEYIEDINDGRNTLMKEVYSKIQEELEEI
jgi:hypothetical protein